MFCPVCNGFQALEELCLLCSGKVSDLGRLSDFADPYAPYEQIVDEQPLSYSLFGNDAVCKHIIYCSTCKQTTEVSVSTMK